MAYEFTKLADVPALEEVPEGANAFIEVEGEIKRVPGDGLGGGGGDGIPTAIIRLTIEPDGSGGTPAVSGTCDNMTFAEAKAILTAGEPMMAVVTYEAEYTDNGVTEHRKYAGSAYGLYLAVETDTVVIDWNRVLLWTPDETITPAE